MVPLKLCCCNHHHIFQQSPVPDIARTGVPPPTVIQGNSRLILSLCSCCTDRQCSHEPWACGCKRLLLILLPSAISMSTETALGMLTAGPRDKGYMDKTCQEGNHSTTVIWSKIPESVKLHEPTAQKKFYNLWPNTVDYVFQTLSN